MADPLHLDLLMQGTAAWNTWRSNNPTVQPDFKEADLSGAKLSNAYLSEADLGRADLRYANLSKADLKGANLCEANLSEAYLGGADLSAADLSKANLSKAYLSHADLSVVTLSEACLAGAYLIGANFSEAYLNGADLSYARMGKTFLGELDLRSVKGLETVIHEGPSHLSLNTLYYSHGKISEIFARGTGASDIFIEYMRSLPTTIQYYSLFVSYAHQDEVLACRLYQDLQNRGVRCWMASHDLRPGDYHHTRIDEAIYLHEKTLLLLSEHAVNSSWVEHEVQIAQAREGTQGCNVLFPLKLDEVVMQTSKNWAVRLRESRHIGNFTGWQDDTVYQQTFTTLLSYLKVTQSSN